MTLFESYTLKNYTLKNKVVMAPMTRSRATSNVPNQLMAEYYSARAGAGLIITEGTAPSPNGLGYPRIPGAFNEEQKKGWKKVTDAVHENGGKIFLQLMHTGRVSHPDNMHEKAQVLAPSAVPLDGKMYTDNSGEQPYPLPVKMSLEQIDVAVNEYIKSAKLAIEAGFDGVELHAANGYLLEQFINPIINKREDGFGGSLEGRLRFPLQVAQGVVHAIGPDKVGMRISPYGTMNGTGEFDSVDKTYISLAKALNVLNIAYLHVLDHESMGAPAVPEKMKKDIRREFTNTIILCGGYVKEKAERDLENGLGDLIAFGRPFIANPDLVERMKNDVDLREPDPNTFYTPGKEGYTTYSKASVLSV